MTTLKTGVKITYNKKGNIDTIYSPYYSEPIKKESLITKIKVWLRK